MNGIPNLAATTSLVGVGGATAAVEIPHTTTTTTTAAAAASTISLSPVSLHCHINDLDKLAQLVEMGADVEGRDSLAFTPLHYAVWNSQDSVVAWLLESCGAQVDAIGDGGRTPLHLSIQNNSTRIAELLIEFGARLDIPDLEGMTALEVARSLGNAEMMNIVASGYQGAIRRIKEKSRREAQQLKTKVKSLKLDLSTKTKLIKTHGEEDVQLIKHKMAKKQEEESIKMKQEISQLVDQVLELKNDQEEMVRSHQHQLDRVVSEVVPRTLEHLLDEYKKVTKLRRAKEEDDMELVVYVQVEHALESFIPFQGADDLLLQATRMEVDYKKAIEALQTFSPASAIGEDFLTHLDRLVDQKGGILENIIVFTTESASSVEDLNRVKQVYIERLEKMQDLLEAYESKYRGHKNFSEYYHPVKVPQIKNGGGGAAGVGAGVNIGNNNQPGDSATSSSDEDLSSLSLSDSEDHDHQESHVNTDISAKNKESIDNPSLTKEDGKYEDEEAEEAVTSNTVLPHATAKSVKRSSRKPSVSFSDSNTSSSKNKSSVESAANAFTTASQTILSKLQETFEKRSSRYRDSSIFTNSSSSTSTTTAAKSAAALGGFFKNFSGGLNPAPSSSLSAFSGSTSDRGVGSAAVTGPTSSLITGLNGILDTFEKWKANRQAEFLRLEKLTNNLSKSLTDQFSHILLGGCDGEFEDSSSNNNNNDNTPPYSTGSATMQFRIQHCISIQQELIAAIAEENQARLAFDPPHSSIREGLRLACQLDYKAVWQIEEITQVFSKLKLVGAQWKRTEYMANDVKFNELYKLQKESRKKMMFAKIEEEDDDPFSTVSIMSSSSSEKRSKKQRAYKDALKEFRCAASLVEEEMFKLKSLASAMYPELFVRLPWLKSTVEFVGSPEVGVFHRSLDLYDVLENNNDSNMDPDSASGALNAVNVGNVAFFKAKIGVRECMLKKVRHLPTESDRQEFIKLSKHQLKYLQHPNLVRPELFFITDKNVGYVQLPIFKNNGDLWSHINSSSSSAASADGNGSNTSGAVKKFVTQAHLQQLARDVLQALSLFENYGLVHGDVRPQTIFVSDDEERAQLEYYGPNVQQHHLQHHHHHYSAQPSTSGAIYMAPEVIKSQQYSLKSDIYSFGLVLYDMHFPSGDTNSLSLSASGVRDSLILSINGKGVSSSDTSSSKSGSGYSLKLSIPDHSCTELSDLMRRLLDLDPAKRPSASDALKHPYFKLKFGLSADNNNNSSSSSSIKSSLKKIEAISSGSTNSIRECVCCLKSFKTLDPSTPSLFECKSSSSSQHHPSHSICQPCLTDLVKSYCQTDPSIIVSNPSAIPLGIPCPGELMDDMVTRGRDPRTRASFSLETLFKALDSETYDEYLSWESEIKELRMFNSVLNAQEVIPVIGGRGAGFSHPEAGSDAETHATFIKNCVASRTCPRCLAPHHAFSIEHSVLSSASSLKMSSAPTSIISLMLDCKRCLGCFCGVCNTQVSGSKSCDSHLKVCTSRNDMKLINHNNSSPSSLALVSHFHDFQRKLSAQRVDKYISSLPESKRVEVMKLL